MAIFPLYRTAEASVLVFSGSLESALSQGFITKEVYDYLHNLPPEVLEKAPKGWEGITGVEIFDVDQPKDPKLTEDSGTDRFSP